LFEIGAAWATSKTFIPIMGPGVTFGDLPAALKNYPAFKVLDTPGRLRDAVKQISSELGIAEKSSGKVEVRMRNFFKTLEEWRPSTPPQVTLDRETVRTQVKIVLEATCRAPIHPHTLTGYPIRAQCRIANTRDKRLEPFCSWSYLIPPDKGLSVDYEGPDKDVLVIAKAYRSNRILAEDLPSNHNELYTGGHKGMIWPELRSVLAAPIRDPADDTSLPIGVISLTVLSCFRECGFTRPKVLGLLIGLQALLTLC
jgi:hypothetical protein